MPSIAMTSNVKSWSQLFSGHHAVFCPRCIGRGGARKIRRLILLLSVGWRPPYVPPSGACLHLGASILYQPLHAAQGATTGGPLRTDAACTAPRRRKTSAPAGKEPRATAPRGDPPPCGPRDCGCVASETGRRDRAPTSAWTARAGSAARWWWLGAMSPGAAGTPRQPMRAAFPTPLGMHKS